MTDSKKEKRFKRIRRLKRWMRPLPRRSNIHKYPILKWFSHTAYKRSYLWSFRGKAIIPSLFWGFWVAMLPIVGIQMLVVFFIALFLRANLPLIVAIQWISNPITMGPIFFANYRIGIEFLYLIGIDYQRNKLLNPKFDWTNFSYSDFVALLNTFPPMMIGGSIIGIFLGVVAVFLYKFSTSLYNRRNDFSNSSKISSDQRKV